MSDQLRFGSFMAPVMPMGENPTLQIRRELEMIEHLDRLGFDEVWVGEHHSGGAEIVASPEFCSPPPPNVPAASAWEPALSRCLITIRFS